MSIHHIDGNPLNNDPANLLLVDEPALKFGDVIKFTYSGTPIVAMVITTDESFPGATDEGTGGGMHTAIVFGLVGGDTGSFHQVGKTANFDFRANPYEVLP